MLEASVLTTAKNETSTGALTNTHLIVSEGLGLEGRNVHLLVAFALLAKGAIGQLAPLVGHEVASLGEGQVLQVQQLFRGHGLRGGGKWLKLGFI